jgi:hypothetical protein
MYTRKQKKPSRFTVSIEHSPINTHLDTGQAKDFMKIVTIFPIQWG